MLTKISQTTLVTIALAGLLHGCGPTQYYSDVPEPSGVEVQEPHRVIRSGNGANSHTVQRGESLSLIAFVVGMDWREIAELNSIEHPYTIYPGQVLRLSPPVSAGTQPRTNTPPSQAVVAENTTPLPLPTPSPSGVAAPGRASSAAQVNGTSASPASSPTLAAAHPPAQTPSDWSSKPVRPGQWHVPSGGTLSGRFSEGSTPHKGIDFSGRAGDPVLASKGGSIVYAGSGVRGYGNLLIVKHDANFLSAYAHNSRLLVKEGDVVVAGQKIAEMGASGTDRVHLHFEVRRQGRPIDPLTVLPKR